MKTINPSEAIGQVVSSLNQAFQDDPEAINCLMCNRVPCNMKLADHPTVQVHGYGGVIEGSCYVGALGLINGVLGAAGIPLVAMKFDDSDENGIHKMLGFCVYEAPDGKPE